MRTREKTSFPSKRAFSVVLCSSFDEEILFIWGRTNPIIVSQWSDRHTHKTCPVAHASAFSKVTDWSAHQSTGQKRTVWSLDRTIRLRSCSTDLASTAASQGQGPAQNDTERLKGRSCWGKWSMTKWVGFNVIIYNLCSKPGNTDFSMLYQLYIFLYYMLGHCMFYCHF